MAVPVPSISCCVLNHHNLFYQIQNALAFNRNMCCHLVLCLWFLPFCWRAHFWILIHYRGRQWKCTQILSNSFVTLWETSSHKLLFFEQPNTFTILIIIKFWKHGCFILMFFENFYFVYLFRGALCLHLLEWGSITH